MFKRNDGLGVNAIQNRFTAMLKQSIHNRKINYMKSLNKRLGKELPLEEYTYSVGEEYDFIQAIVDYDTVRTALKDIFVEVEKEKISIDDAIKNMVVMDLLLSLNIDLSAPIFLL